MIALTPVFEKRAGVMCLRLIFILVLNCLLSILAQAGLLDGGEHDPELKTPEIWFGERFGDEHIPYTELTAYIDYL